MDNHSPMNDDSANAQCLRILNALRQGSKTTFDLIRECNAVRPGARITELRQRGYKINTVRMTTVDDYGRKHRGVAVYTLLGEGSPCM